MRKVWSILKAAFSDFLADDAMAWAAAIAFYTALSFAPIVLLLISVGDFIGRDTREGMIGEVQKVLGDEAGGIIETIVSNANEQQGNGVVPFLISLGVTLFSASAVFGQLQVALNHIWEVKPAPGGGGLSSVWTWLRKRMLSMGMVLAIAFLLIASLVASAVVSYVVPADGLLAQLGTVIVSLVIFVPLFALMFKFLPDAKVQWIDVIFGSVLTSILFLIGKTLIGLYLGMSGVGSAYGAAGSLILLLVWVYYSAIILLFGAEITQSRAQQYGHGLVPEDHAERRANPHRDEQPPADAQAEAGAGSAPA